MHPIKFAYYDLANAIVEQAAIDYRNALNGVSYDRRYSPESVIKETEKFFRSEWYRTLTNVDGEYLIANLKKEHKEKEQI